MLSFSRNNLFWDKKHLKFPLCNFILPVHQYLIQWWFVNPDTFVPAGNFRINEFSGLLNRPSPDVRELLINVLYCSQLIASFRGIYVALKRVAFCFFSVCFWPLKRPLYCFFSICLWPRKWPFGIPTIMPLLLKEVGDRRLLAAGGWSFL